MLQKTLEIMGAEFIPAHTQTIEEFREDWAIPDLWHLKHLDVLIDPPPIENPAQQAWVIHEIKHWLRERGIDFMSVEWGDTVCQAVCVRGYGPDWKMFDTGFVPTELEAWCRMAVKVSEGTNES